MDSSSDSDISEVRKSPRIFVTKWYEFENCGLVSIRGWTDNITRGRFALFTVVDESNQSRWFRLAAYPSMWNDNSEQLEITVPGSSIPHNISVTMELLREIRSIGRGGGRGDGGREGGGGGGGGGGGRHFTVDSGSTCVALATFGSVTLDRFASFLSRVELANEPDCELQTTILMNIERRSFNRTKLRLLRLTPSVHRWLIRVNSLDRSFEKRVFLIPVTYDETRFEFPVSFKAGSVYHIEAFGLGPYDGRVLCQNYTDFRAELTVSDLLALYDMARSFAGSRSALCRWLYRNKPPKYFDDILLHRAGIMEVYVKDNSGDPGSPINGYIHGLFFMASVQPGSEIGEPERRSAFGSCRLCIPVEEMLQMAVNLYFADFYCMRSNKRHYVTLVTTKTGSAADRFCADRLLPLTVKYPYNNPFLFSDVGGRFRVSAKSNLSVEVLFTEDIDIQDYKIIHDVWTFGKGHSTKGGRPKNLNCEKCSLMMRPSAPFRSGDSYARLIL